MLLALSTPWPEPMGLPAGSDNKGSRIWDTKSGQELLSLKNTGPALGLAFSPDGKRLACSDNRSQIKEQYGKRPKQALVDSAYATQDSVTVAESTGTQVVSTIPRADQLTQHGKDPHAQQRRDTLEYALFRARMAEPEYQKLYQSRPLIAEFPNADCRNRNLRPFRVHGLVKVEAVALWHALAFNLLRLINPEVLVA